MIRYRLEFFVGLFVVLSIACLLVIIFKFTDMQNINNPTKKYKLKAIFRNIGHLKVKAKITIYGVKVGFVDQINLIKNDLNEYHVEVTMMINLNINCIPKDSTVSIFMTNLLGDNYVQIDLGNDNTFLQDGDVIFLTNQALIIEDLISKFAFNK
ncbi:MAG TPA: MlaD family protein [Candidatus Azoamicus sp. OHIO2]